MAETMREKRWLQKLTKVSHKPFTSPSFHPEGEGGRGAWM
jgi:hypothetical protein